ncbi:MAG: YceI family protein [Bacteroidota bacterium]
MKKVLLFLSMVVSLAANAQDKYLTRNAKVVFDATTSTSPEKIEGVNNQGISVFVAQSGQYEFSIQMQAFEFEKALMKDHFNENYVETSKFPKAVFKGSIQDVAKVNFAKDGKYPVVVKGTMDLHGVKKEVTADGSLTVSGGKITAASTFKLLLSDYKVEIPKLVGDKVAKQATITVNATYNKM